MYSKNEKAIIWLNMFDFLTTKKQEEILAFFDQPKDIFEWFSKSFGKLENIISQDQFNKMNYALNEDFLNTHILNLESQNIKVLTYCSEYYPQIFFNFEDKPTILYYKGDISLLKTTCIGIVGTRKPTGYGKLMTEKYARELASNGITIVSGLASGVDCIAHKACLEVGGKTIAVMGSGFNHIYPSTNYQLEKQIEKTGLVITEYLPDVLPAQWHYPIRNRIIAGLSKAVLITEASTKSGTMHTKNYCLDYGTDLYAIPGEITSFASSGTNQIIKCGQGALTTEPEDILKDLNISSTFQPKVANLQLSFEEQTILNALDSELHFDILQQKTQIDTKTLLTLLTKLEIEGLVEKLNGNYYCKI